MDIQEERAGDIQVVVLKGRLDGAASPAFIDRVESLIAGSQPKLLLDLAEVSLVTSAGLRAILMIAKRIKAGEGAFILCALQAPVRDVLDLSGFTPMLRIYASRAEGMAAF